MRWSADACATLMSEETSLCAVLIAASADSTFRRRIDAGDQRRVEPDAVARRRRGALLVHLLVELAQVLAQVVDRNPLHHRRLDAAAARHDRSVVTTAIGGASKFAMRSRRIETK
jgi:hypothetical protein